MHASILCSRFSLRDTLCITCSRQVKCAAPGKSQLQEKEAFLQELGPFAVLAATHRKTCFCCRISFPPCWQLLAGKRGLASKKSSLSLCSQLPVGKRDFSKEQEPFAVLAATFSSSLGLSGSLTGVCCLFLVDKKKIEPALCQGG